MKCARNITDRIFAWNRGRVFFLSDFADLGNEVAVRKQISRLCSEGTILRYGRGIYYYPVVDHKWGLGTIPATNDDIAMAYSQKNGITLYHSKAAAQNLLGLSTQNQMNAVYFTNGHTRYIDTGIGNGITLTHIGDTRLSLFKDNTMRLISIALHGEKAERINQDWLNTLSTRLSSVSEESFSHDIRLLSQQTRLIVLSCRKILS